MSVVEAKELQPRTDIPEDLLLDFSGLRASRDAILNLGEIMVIPEDGSVAPMHDHIRQALDEELAEFQRLMLSTCGLIKLELLDPRVMEANSYTNLLRAYGNGVSELLIPSHNLNAARTLAYEDSDGTTYPTTNARITTPFDAPSYVFDQEQRGMVESPNLGRWYGLPLRHVAISILE